MNLVFLGPPGVGKGTQAKLLTNEYELTHVATGDLLREAVKKNTPLGIQVKEIISRGELVPDEIVFSLVKERLQSPSANGFVFDGFPRNISQAEQLDKYLKEINKKLDRVIYFQFPEEEIIRRLSARRICSRCQANYNLITQPPSEETVCDLCKGELIQRSDDRPETIKERLKIYQKETAPLIEYYENKKILKKIDASFKVEEIYSSLKSTLSNFT